MKLNRKYIRQRREELGLSLGAAAKAAGWHYRQAWQNIEAGRAKNTSLETINKMARVLQVKALKLVE